MIETLRRARAIIAKPEKFCTGWLAQDANGNAVHLSAPHAKRYCLLGACLKASPDFVFPRYLEEAFFEGNVAVFTDRYGQVPVLRALDDAIEYLELTR